MISKKSLISFLIFSLFIPVMAHGGGYSKMPRFALPSADDGKTVVSDDFQGKVILINFFATWCPPCRQEIPELIKVQTQFQKKGFTVIGISLDEGKNSRKLVKKFKDKRKMNYPVLMGDNKVTRDFGGVEGVPVSFLVDREGKIVRIYQGYNPLIILMTEIDQVVNKTNN